MLLKEKTTLRETFVKSQYCKVLYFNRHVNICVVVVVFSTLLLSFIVVACKCTFSMK